MEPISSTRTTVTHNTEKSNQYNSNPVIGEMAQTAELASSECFINKNMLENDKSHEGKSELNPSPLSSSRQDISSGLSNTEAAIAEFPKSEHAIDSGQENNASQDFDNVDGEDDEEISLDDIEEVEQREEDYSTEINNNTDIVGEKLTIEDNEETLVNVGMEEKGEARSEIVQVEKEINKGESKVIQGEKEINKEKANIFQGEKEINKGKANVFQGEKKINIATPVEMKTIETIETQTEKMKDIFILNISNPQEAKKAIETGNYQNITNVSNANIAYRFRIDPKNREIIVPKESPLEPGSKIPIKDENGVEVEHTVRQETKQERKEFKKNWSTFIALQQQKENTNTDKSEEQAGTTAQGTLSAIPPKTNPSEDHQLNKKINGGIIAAQLNTNAPARMKNAAQVQETKRRKINAEEIRKEDFKKELGGKRIGKDRLNFDLIKQIADKTVEAFKSFNISNITRSILANIVLLANRCRKFA